MMKSKSHFTPSYLAVMRGLSVTPVSRKPSSRHGQHLQPREVEQPRKVKSKLSWRWNSNKKRS